MKLPRLLRIILGLTEKERQAEIAASDQRVTDILVDVHKDLSKPGTPAAVIEAGSQLLDEITVNLKKGPVIP